MTQSRDFYAILGVSKDADENSLKKAYKKLAMKWHPDKHKKNKETAEAKFKDIAEAYAILSDTEKRKVYDMYGEEGLKAGVKSTDGGPQYTYTGGGFENIDPNEIFARFFGQGGRGGASFGGFDGGNGTFVFTSGGGQPGMKGFSAGGGSPFSSMFGNMQDPMDVEGEDYASYNIPQSFRRSAPQPQPRKRKLEKITPCNHEVKCTLEENYAGVTKKVKVTRKVVDGSGRLSQESKVLEIPIKAGMKEGTKFTFHGEGDQGLNHAPQDLIFTLKNKPHAKFRRDGDDLHHTVDLSLDQATKGSQVKVPTIEGKTIGVLTQPLKQSSDTLTLIGQGMINSKTQQRGNLILHFNVKFNKI